MIICILFCKLLQIAKWTGWIMQSSIVLRDAEDVGPGSGALHCMPKDIHHAGVRICCDRRRTCDSNIGASHVLQHWRMHANVGHVVVRDEHLAVEGRELGHGGGHCSGGEAISRGGLESEHQRGECRMK
jgi:hypothetical protein